MYKPKSKHLTMIVTQFDFIWSGGIRGKRKPTNSEAMPSDENSSHWPFESGLDHLKIKK